MTTILALWNQPMSAWGIPDFLILLMVICGCLGIAYIVLQVCEINIPPWVWKIAFIVLAVFVGVVAIRLLQSM